jgi:hypothetical protein
MHAMVKNDIVVPWMFYDISHPSVNISEQRGLLLNECIFLSQKF